MSGGEEETETETDAGVEAETQEAGVGVKPMLMHSPAICRRNFHGQQKVNSNRPLLNGT
jgi:hypothetical protein